MLDYDDISALQAITDGCLNGAAGVEVLTEHAGVTASRAFFVDLFETPYPDPRLGPTGVRRGLPKSPRAD